MKRKQVTKEVAVDMRDKFALICKHSLISKKKLSLLKHKSKVLMIEKGPSKEDPFIL